MKDHKIASMAENQYGERVIRISFPYDPDMVTNVRTLIGRRYHKENRCWSAPIHEKTLNQLISWDFSLDEKLKEFLVRIHKNTQTIVSNEIEGLNGKLFPFQKEGVAFIENKGGRALLADEMGLGKTIQALAWLQMHPDKRPVIIVVPASLKLNWKKETQLWMSSPNVEIIYGTQPYSVKGDIIIINYDIILPWVEILKNLDPQVLITDECHYFKSNRAKRTKAIKQLGKGIPHVIALSGTPIINRPIEAYNALRLIDPTLFANYQFYIRRYCNAHYTGFGWDLSGASCTEELHQILIGSVMIRRLKKDVLPELPPKMSAFVPMELDNTDDYNAAEEDFINYVSETKGDEAARRASRAIAFAKIETLKQLAVKGKLRHAIEWIKGFLDIDGKLVIFAFHTEIINKLVATFGNMAVKYDGTMSGTAKETAKEAFQNDPRIRLFVGNLRAAGLGLTLTAASNVGFLELPWTPGDLDQCSDRLHRIGQKDSVMIHHLLASNTIEERIAQLIDNKRIVVNAILDGKITDQESLLTKLIKSYEIEM